jgi:Cu2+-exporting ATPase
VRQNLHPIASALREALMARGTAPATLDQQPEECIGFGIEARYGGYRWRLGKPSWATMEPSRGRCVFSRDGLTVAEFDFVESLRSDTVQTLNDFHTRGMRIAILSGDRTEKVDRLVADLGGTVDAGLGDLTPDEKAAWLKANHGDATLMIGDGANDSLAFSEALCTGTPAIDRGLLEKQADFYFLGRSLAGLRALFETARLRLKAVHGVMAFAIAYNAVAVALSAAGYMNPLLAAILMPLSSLVTLAIVIATLRSRRVRESQD